MDGYYFSRPVVEEKFDANFDEPGWRALKY